MKRICIKSSMLFIHPNKKYRCSLCWSVQPPFDTRHLHDMSDNEEQLFNDPLIQFNENNIISEILIQYLRMSILQF